MRKVVPERIKTLVGHLEDSADVGRLALIQKEVGRGRVVVLAVSALEKAQRDERVEEVARRTRMQAKASLDGCEVLGMLGEFGKQFHLDGAQERFGGPEAQAHLHDVIHPGFARFPSITM